jgi:hypothetical protein
MLDANLRKGLSDLRDHTKAKSIALNFQFKMLDGEVVIHGIYVPLVANRKIPMNCEDALSVYKNFIDGVRDFTNRHKVRVHVVSILALWKNLALWEYGFQRTPLQCTLAGTPLCDKAGTYAFLYGASYAPKETYNKVQTHSIIRAVEETHYYETCEDRRIETLDGCAEADSVTKADAAERSSPTAKDAVKQQGYVYKGHSCQYSTHDERER